MSAAIKQVTVKLVKSAIGYNISQKLTLKALGLTKMNQIRTYNDSPQVRGMLNAVRHLVEVIK